MARIAQAAGVNKQLIFYYFGSKAGLYDEVTATAAAAAEADGSASGGGPARLRWALGHMLRVLSDHPELSGLLSEAGRGTGSPEHARAVVAELMGPAYEAVSQGQGLGHFRDDADAKLTAAQGLALCYGYTLLQTLLEGQMTSPERWLEGAGELLARGLAW